MFDALITVLRCWVFLFSSLIFPAGTFTFPRFLYGFSNHGNESGNHVIGPGIHADESGNHGDGQYGNQGIKPCNHGGDEPGIHRDDLDNQVDFLDRNASEPDSHGDEPSNHGALESDHGDESGIHGNHTTSPELVDIGRE